MGDWANVRPEPARPQRGGRPGRLPARAMVLAAPAGRAVAHRLQPALADAAAVGRARGGGDRVRGDRAGAPASCPYRRDRKSTRLNSSHVAISYAVFCLKKKKEHPREPRERRRERPTEVSKE